VDKGAQGQVVAGIVAPPGALEFGGALAIVKVYVIDR